MIRYALAALAVLSVAACSKPADPRLQQAGEDLKTAASATGDAAVNAASAANDAAVSAAPAMKEAARKADVAAGNAARAIDHAADTAADHTRAEVHDMTRPAPASSNH